MFFISSSDTDGVSTFQSVILAGVTDVKHLKSRIREEDESKEPGVREVRFGDLVLIEGIVKSGPQKHIDRVN